MISNFGKYVIPPTLQRLIDLRNILEEDEQFYRGLNFHLSLKNFRYSNTPSDVVVFGNVGLDGIHYGILTDFGSVTDLEVAPIVCVSPMDFGCPTRIVAQNLCEFLRVNLTEGELFYNQYESEETYLEAKNQWITEAANSPFQPSKTEKLIRKKATNFLMENIQMPTINNPYQYVQHVEMERQRNVVIQTQDGLGVTTRLLQGEKHVLFPIHKDIDPDLILLQEYLYTSPVASRLALFRDIQLNYTLQDNQELYKIVADAMVSMELIDEATRLSEII